MSWEDADGLERGGACNECGEQVEEEYYAYCRSCYRDQMGWSRPDRDALREQHAERQRAILAGVVARLDRLEATVRRLERERAA
jgi:hypothetical protein